MDLLNSEVINMALGKPSPVSITLAVVVVGIIVFLTYQSTTKENSQNYTKGAVHNQTTLTISPVENNYPLALPRCGRLFSVDPDWAKQFDKPEDKKVKK